MPIISFYLMGMSDIIRSIPASPFFQKLNLLTDVPLFFCLFATAFFSAHTAASNLFARPVRIQFSES